MWIDILIALAAVGVLALVLGGLLAVVSHFFYVEENQTAKELRAALPGINCGVCGFRGCDDYAVAMAEGKAKPSLCVPGAEGVAATLAGILGVEAEMPKDEVAFVHCNGHCEATARRATYEGVQSCAAAAALFGGPDACLYGCLGLGDCATACPAAAICLDDGIAHVDTTACLGCGLCVDTCPKHIISLVPQEARAVVMCNNRDRGAEARRVCKNACIGCRKCEKACPHGAITVEDNLARIDYEKCTGCGACVAVCPTGCLHSVRFPDLGERAEV